MDTNEEISLAVEHRRVCPLRSMAPLGSTQSSPADSSEPHLPDLLPLGHPLRDYRSYDRNSCGDGYWYPHDSIEYPGLPGIHRVEEQAQVVPEVDE